MPPIINDPIIQTDLDASLFHEDVFLVLVDNDTMLAPFVGDADKVNACMTQHEDEKQLEDKCFCLVV